MNIATIIQLKFPDADLLSDVIVKDDGDGKPYIKEWHIPDVPKPTKKTLDKWAKEVEDAHELQQVRRQRKAEYGPIGDQLDAILKQLNYDRLNGRGMIQDADDAINHWLAVKAKYPKPSDK